MWVRRNDCIKKSKDFHKYFQWKKVSGAKNKEINNISVEFVNCDGKKSLSIKSNVSAIHLIRFYCTAPFTKCTHISTLDKSMFNHPRWLHKWQNSSVLDNHILNFLTFFSFFWCKFIVFVLWMIIDTQSLYCNIQTWKKNQILRLSRHNVLCVHAGLRSLPRHSALRSLDAENMQRT